MTIDEDGYSIYESSGNLRGAYEGPIVENDEGQLIFEGHMEDEGDSFESEWVILYDEDDDTMTMSRPDDEEYSDIVHERIE